MEFENVSIDNVEEVVDVIEEVVPKKGIKISDLGKGAIIGTIATAAIIATVKLVKKVRAKKAAEKEEPEIEVDDEECYDENECDYADVEGK